MSFLQDPVRWLFRWICTWVIEAGMLAVVVWIYIIRSIDLPDLAPIYSIQWVLCGTLLAIGVVGWVRFIVQATARVRSWLSLLRSKRRRAAMNRPSGLLH